MPKPRAIKSQWIQCDVFVNFPSNQESQRDDLSESKTGTQEGIEFPVLIFVIVQLSCGHRWCEVEVSLLISLRHDAVET